MDGDVDLLLAKLEKWLVMQPEYPRLFLEGRHERRAAAKALADAVFTIPAAEKSDSLPRRYRRVRGM